MDIIEGGSGLTAPAEAEQHLRGAFRLSCCARLLDGAGPVRAQTMRRATMRVEASAMNLPAAAQLPEPDPAVTRVGDRVLLDGSGRLAPVADDGSNVIDTVGKGLRSIEDQILSMYTLAEGQRPRGQVPFKFSVRTNYSCRDGPLAGEVTQAAEHGSPAAGRVIAVGRVRHDEVPDWMAIYMG